MRQRIFSVAACVVLLSSVGATAKGDDFDLADGAQVTLIGNTLIERAQTFGYLETALTARWPERNITFRNLGWSGDTVFGEARAGFGSAKDGFRHLKDHVTALKPTVLLVGYGANASFDGAEKLPSFVRGMEKLLETLAATRANIVLLAPIRHEDLGPPLPEPAVHNRQLALYRDAIGEIAESRGRRFIDLFCASTPAAQTVLLRATDCTLRLTAIGGSPR